MQVKGASEVGIDDSEDKKPFFWMKCVILHTFTALIQCTFSLTYITRSQQCREQENGLLTAGSHT